MRPKEHPGSNKVDCLANSPLVGQVLFKQNITTRMTTTKAHDNLNRLTTISAAGTGATPSVSSYIYAYNSANQRVSVALGDGSYWAYEYDSLGQVKSGKRYWNDGTPVAGQQFEYAHDDIGNRTSTKAGGDAGGANLRTGTYTRNRLNQYTQRTVPGSYDVMGAARGTVTITGTGSAVYRKDEFFRKEVTVVNSSVPVWSGVTVTATSGTSVNSSGNSYVPKTAEVFTYDLDGNVLTDGRWTYTWDGENRLTRLRPVTAVGPQTQIDFEYDWQGRRIAKKVWNNATGTSGPKLSERFLYDGWNLVAQLNATNNAVVRSYVWGSDLSGSLQGAGGVGGLLAVKDTANGTHFAAYDGNGNVVALVSATDASVSARYEYGPFGELLRGSGSLAKLNPFRFSTKFQDDETDQLYYGYRYLSTSAGRWLSRDPLTDVGAPPVLAVPAQDSAIASTDDLESRDSSLAIAVTSARNWMLGYANGSDSSYTDSDYSFVGNSPIYSYDLFGLVVRPTCSEVKNKRKCLQWSEFYEYQIGIYKGMKKDCLNVKCFYRCKCPDDGCRCKDPSCQNHGIEDGPVYYTGTKGNPASCRNKEGEIAAKYQCPFNKL